MEAKRDFIVGVTALAGFAGLAIMLIMFGELAWLTRDRYDLTLVLPDAKGVSNNAIITLNGVDVGRVTTMRTFDDPRQGVSLNLAINNRVRIPRDVTITVQEALFGAATLAMKTEHISQDEPEAGPEAYFQPGDTFRRQAQGMLEQVAAMIDARLEGLTGAADSFRRLTDTYVRVGQSIERLVTPGQGPEGDRPPVNLPEMLANLDAAISGARGWLDDEQLHDDANAVMHGARETLAKLADAVDAWTRTAHTLQENADRLGAGFEEGLRGFVEATSSLNDALAEIRSIADRITRGEGTLGQLVNNPDLYRSINDAAIRLETALREAQLMIEKFRKEGVPVQF